MIVSAESLPPVIPIPLEPHTIASDANVWHEDKRVNTMPRGRQSLAGAEFILDGLLRIKGKADAAKAFRESVIIPLVLTNFTAAGAEEVWIGTNVGCLHLLGGTVNATEAGAVIEVVWHYSDDSTARTPVRHHQEIRAITRDPYETPVYLPSPHSKVVWSAPHYKEVGKHLRLYRVLCANPEPSKAVRDPEIASAMSLPSLFVLGLTLDPLLPGQRPDDSPNLEPADPLPPSQVYIGVVDPNGRPVPGARIETRIVQRQGVESRYFGHSVVTDTAGGAQLNAPPYENIERFEASATHEDFGGRKVAWSPGTGQVIPASYTFTLGKGITFGGLVVDEAGMPISGAKLDFYRYWTGGDDMNLTGDQADFRSRSVTTDERGAWQAKGLPPELLSRIGFNVTHSDFVGTNFHMGDASHEPQLLAGTHKIVLRRGVAVVGRVVDELSQPVKGAQVWAGRMHSQGTQDTKTDDRGAFRFRNVSAGFLRFSALAEGLQAAVREIEVQPGMPEIVLKLSRGSSVRGIVKDESGNPVPGARLSLESASGGSSEDYRFEMLSGADGLFEWLGAPEDPQNFAVLKSGYEAKRRVTLKPGEFNEVTLRKGRTVRGLVLEDQTGHPMPKFRMGAGSQGLGASFYAQHPGMRDYANTDGTFETQLDEESQNAIKVEAEDYADKIEALPPAENGVINPTFRLKASPTLRAILVNAQGQPVPGGTVALSVDMDYAGSLQLQNGRLKNFGGSKIVTTGADGSFVLSSPPEQGMVVAAAESGFACVPPGGTAQVRFGEDGAVVQGRVISEYQPAEGEKIYFSGHLTTSMPALPQNFSSKEEATAYFASAEWREMTRNRRSFAVAVDSAGALSSDSVSPGEYTLTAQASKVGKQPWEQITVAAGSVNVTVPEAASPNTPIQIEDVILKPAPRRPGNSP